jgi:hypothetical protein
MKQWKLTSLALAGAAGLAACSDTLPTEPRAELHDPGYAPPSALRGLNGEFTRLAEEIPGFGGMYYGDDGKLNVFVAGNTTSPAALTRALETKLRGELLISAKTAPAANEMVVHQGDYDFGQLSRWYTEMWPVLGMEGVVFTDIDEASNRLRIGVEAGVSHGEIREALARFNVPVEAVNIEITEPIVPLDGSTLQQRVQPFGGGLQLVFPNPMPGFISLCTLGFNILRDAPGRSVDYFVTNSHCTLNRGTVENTPYYQQPIAPLNPKQLIGIEVMDPPFFQCSPTLVCRWSDAAIARYETARTPVRFGSIYRTAFFGTGNAAGSIEIGGSNPKFFSITDEAPFPLGGEVVDKVGRTTGWTRGPVIGTCLNVGIAGLPNTVMLCQDFVQAALAGGDSGSPVFKQAGDSKNATLYGILWGGGLIGDAVIYVFSAMENIHLDLGDFRTH